jgi:hypothetical protein
MVVTVATDPHRGDIAAQQLGESPQRLVFQSTTSWAVGRADSGSSGRCFRNSSKPRRAWPRMD